MSHLPEFIDKMKGENLPQIVIDTFAFYYQQVVAGVTGLISNKEIRPVTQTEIANARLLGGYAGDGRAVLGQTVLIVLNGGLGTSMGLTKAKSLLTVKNGKTFLKIIIDQAASFGVNLVFMNSFNTHADTVAAVQALQPESSPRFFLQHKYPKILRDGFAPVRWPDDPGLEWNPPGHGEIYTALYTSGLLGQLLQEGVRYALIVNSDNLGATMDPSLLGYFSKHNLPFMMEVSQRTPTDMKGGHIARHKSGRLILREIAQCSDKDLAAFQDIQYYRFFNVNSLWVNLNALDSLIQSSKVIKLPIILNPKTVNPRDKDSPDVYQIETAMGAAISLFDGAAAVEVTVERFRPVKKCSDLLAVRSDCFIFDTAGCLVPNPERDLGRIQIHLDPGFYGNIEDFEKRFSQGVPSLIGCESLTIQGDVYFEKDVVINGHVRIHNPHARAAVVPAGTVIDGNMTL